MNETPAGTGSRQSAVRGDSLKGIAFMAVSALTISLMHVLVRDLAREVHPLEIAFFRNVVGFTMLLPFLLRQERSSWKSKQPLLQLFRSILGTGALLTWFTTLSLMPVGDATAISFMTVLFVTVGASLILGEKVGIRRWTAILVGFAGTLIIVRPGGGVIGTGALVALASTVFWASAILCVKVLSRTDSSVTMVFYNNVYMTIFSLVPAIWVWAWPTWEQAGLMVVIGVMATLAHLCIAQALRYTDATTVAPVDYTRLIWASAVGYLVFGEFPDVWTWVGGTVVFASTLYITYREARVKRKAREADAA